MLSKWTDETHCTCFNFADQIGLKTEKLKCPQTFFTGYSTSSYLAKLRIYSYYILYPLCNACDAWPQTDIYIAIWLLGYLIHSYSCHYLAWLLSFLCSHFCFHFRDCWWTTASHFRRRRIWLHWNDIQNTRTEEHVNYILIFASGKIIIDCILPDFMCHLCLSENVLGNFTLVRFENFVLQFHSLHFCLLTITRHM
jgi:hypothetical protein